MMHALFIDYKYIKGVVMTEKKILSGDEAVAYGALAAGVKLGSGYPGTPSTEILETFASIGGKAQWAPNEKVAFEVGVGSAFAGARTVVTMKHVGVNVAADALFTFTYTGTKGGFILVSADDPGMASSQNEQDNRNYAKFAQMPMLEPSDSQEAYDFTIKALEISEKFGMPVMLRMTTRVCHSQTIVDLWKTPEAPRVTHYEKNVTNRVMVPAFAKKAHVRLVQTMKALAAFNEAGDLNSIHGSSNDDLGIITSGVAYQHTLEAAPDAKILKLGMTWPLPLDKIREFAKGVKRLIVVEEGTRFLEENLKAAGIAVDSKDEIFEYGELNVERVKKLIAHDTTPDLEGAPGRPPALCPGCPHRKSFEALRDMGCIVSGDIGCYTLGVMPPFSAIDCCVCMGASIGMGLGLRHALPEDEARKVVSVIGDSTFIHSGITGLVEMAYNRPETGHLVLILDNSTTAMTGLQENPATGRKLNMEPTPHKLIIEDIAKASGVDNVDVIDPVVEYDKFVDLIKTRLASNDTSVIVVRRPCILEIKKAAKLAKKA